MGTGTLFSVIVVILVAIVVGLVWALVRGSGQDENDRLAENATVVESFDLNGHACADNFNTATAAAEQLLAEQLTTADEDTASAQHQLHTLNHQVASSVQCLLSITDWMLPGPDAGKTQVANNTGLVPVGAVLVPFQSPVYKDNPIRNLVCPDETKAPRAASVELATELAWWQSTASRLVGVGEPEIGFAFDTHMTLRDRVVQPGSGLWPVIDSTGQGRAWLTFDTDSRRVTVNPPSPLAVESYCADLAADR